MGQTFTRHDGQEYEVSVGDVVFVTNDYEQRYRDPGWVKAVVAKVGTKRVHIEIPDHGYRAPVQFSGEDQTECGQGPGLFWFRTVTQREDYDRRRVAKEVIRRHSNGIDWKPSVRTEDLQAIASILEGEQP